MLRRLTTSPWSELLLCLLLLLVYAHQQAARAAAPPQPTAIDVAQQYCGNISFQSISSAMANATGGHAGFGGCTGGAAPVPHRVDITTSDGATMFHYVQLEAKAMTHVTITVQTDEATASGALATRHPSLKSDDRSTNVVLDPNFAASPPLSAVWSCSTSVYKRVTDVSHPPATAAMRYFNDDPKSYHSCTQKIKGLLPGWRYNASVWVRSANITGTITPSNIGGSTLCVEFAKGSTFIPGGIYPAGVKGTSDWTQIWGVVTVPADATIVSISVYTRAGLTGTAWWDGVSLTALPPLAPSMKTSLLSPMYRGRITGETAAKGGCETIRLMAQLDYVGHEHDRTDIVLVATLSSDKGNAGAIETVTATGDKIQPMVTVLFKTAPSSLAAGEYAIHCTLRNKTSTSIWNSTNHSITRVASGTAAPTAYFDEQQRLIHNGQPKFPLGLYLGSVFMEDLDIISKSKFNMIMPYVEPANLSVMDDIHSRGLSVAFSTKGSYFGGPNQAPNIITSRAKEEGYIKAQITKFKDHPALLAWYLNDELNVDWMADLEAHYRWTAAGDSSEPMAGCVYVRTVLNISVVVRRSPGLGGAV